LDKPGTFGEADIAIFTCIVATDDWLKQSNTYLVRFGAQRFIYRRLLIFHDVNDDWFTISKTASKASTQVGILALVGSTTHR
jgi:hypothetical protein